MIWTTVSNADIKGALQQEGLPSIQITCHWIF